MSKGSKSRVSDRQRFGENFDKIDWGQKLTLDDAERRTKELIDKGQITTTEANNMLYWVLADALMRPPIIGQPEKEKA